MRSRIEVALLSDGSEGSEALRPILEQTLADAESMIATFNALLDIARAEAGSERAAFEDVGLAAVVNDIVDLYQPLAEDKGQIMDITIESDAVVSANRHLLSQALANLLDNAVKYTPAGGRISLAVARGPSITVADSGPGIPESARDKVLERFVRLDETRATPGNGLGLSLVAAVAGLHGAKLVLEGNEPGLRVRLDFQNLPSQNRKEQSRPMMTPAKAPQSLGQEAKA
jgi:signal transduction histidine kinase